MHKLNEIYYFIEDFNSKEIEFLDVKISIIYRNYKKKINLNLLRKIKKICKRKGRKFYIANNVKIAKNLNLDGVYIPAFNTLNNFQNLNVSKNFKLIGSCHNIIELKIKENQGCDEIFISPIFKNKKSDHFLDINKFNNIAQNSPKKIVALGGINNSNIKKLKLTNSKSFSSINWIKKNRPNKLGRFYNFLYSD